MNSPLRTIRLYGKLGARFGRKFRLAVESPAEAVRALCAMLDGFERYLTESKDKGITFAVFVGDRNIGKDDLHFPAGRAEIRIAPVLIGAKRSGVLQTILGIVLIVVGVIGNIYGGWGTPFIQAGIGLLVGGVAQMLAPQPKGSSAGDKADNKASYAFNGPVNTQAQGNPVPVCYGRMIVGSAVISAGISAVDQVYVPTSSAASGGGLGSGGGGGGGSPPWHLEQLA